MGRRERYGLDFGVFRSSEAQYDEHLERWVWDNEKEAIRNCRQWGSDGKTKTVKVRGEQAHLFSAETHAMLRNM